MGSWFLLGVLFKISEMHPVLFYIGVPPDIPGTKYRYVRSKAQSFLAPLRPLRLLLNEKFSQCSVEQSTVGYYQQIYGAFVWDQSGIRIIGIMRVSVCLGAILIKEDLDFHSGYSTPRSRIAGIYSGIHSGIYSGINSYSGISQTNAPLVSQSKLTQIIKNKRKQLQHLTHFKPLQYTPYRLFQTAFKQTCV